MRVPIQVLVYPVRRKGGEWQYLMLRRVPERSDHWQGVTGAPEWDETVAEGARRELLEETGLTPIELVPLDFSYSLPMQERWKPLYPDGVAEIVEHAFVAFVEAEEPTLDSVEHDAWRWCTYEEAMSLLFWPGNREALKICHRVVLARREHDSR